MTPPRWLTLEIVLAVHGELLAEHGGSEGLRDQGGLESALARPQQKYHYESPGLHELAAAYAFGLSSNHPFVDGNKRIALAALDVFLRLNGLRLVATEVETTSIILQLASGELEERTLADWVQGNTTEA